MRIPRCITTMLASATLLGCAQTGSYAPKPVTQGVIAGEILPLGNDAIMIWHAPGHTPEHVSLLVADKTRARHR